MYLGDGTLSDTSVSHVCRLFIWWSGVTKSVTKLLKLTVVHWLVYILLLLSPGGSTSSRWLMQKLSSWVHFVMNSFKFKRFHCDFILMSLAKTWLDSIFNYVPVPIMDCQIEVSQTDFYICANLRLSIFFLSTSNTWKSHGERSGVYGFPCVEFLSSYSPYVTWHCPATRLRQCATVLVPDVLVQTL